MAMFTRLPSSTAMSNAGNTPIVPETRPMVRAISSGCLRVLTMTVESPVQPTEDTCPGAEQRLVENAQHVGTFDGCRVTDDVIS